MSATPIPARPTDPDAGPRPTRKSRTDATTIRWTDRDAAAPGRFEEITLSRHPIKLYRHPLSGHAHRVELMLSLLGVASEHIEVDLVQGEHKRPEFLARNPFGQVPVIDDEGFVLADSNAILVYLAKRYGAGRWLPESAAEAAAVQRWLGVAAGPIASGPATARLITVFGATYDADAVIDRSHALLRVVDAELAGLTGFVPMQRTAASLERAA